MFDFCTLKVGNQQSSGHGFVGALTRLLKRKVGLLKNETDFKKGDKRNWMDTANGMVWKKQTNRTLIEIRTLLRYCETSSLIRKLKILQIYVHALTSRRNISISSMFTQTKALRSFNEIWFSTYLAFLESFILSCKENNRRKTRMRVKQFIKSHANKMNTKIPTNHER